MPTTTSINIIEMIFLICVLFIVHSLKRNGFNNEVLDSRLKPFEFVLKLIYILKSRML